MSKKQQNQNVKYQKNQSKNQKKKPGKAKSTPKNNKAKKKRSKRVEEEWKGLYFLVGLFSVLSVAAICLVIVTGWYHWKQNKQEKKAEYSESTQVRKQAKASVAEPGEATSQIKSKEESSTEQESQPNEGSDILINLDEIDAGTELTEDQLDLDQLERYFSSCPISDEIYQRINGKSYKEDGIVPREDLRYLKVLHYGFDHEYRVGELIVNVGLAEEFLEIFQELFEEEYEIEKMELVDNYEADDYISIENNNTSCFNYREVTGGSSLSNHARGCAIDINPQQNPYVTYSDGQPVWSHTNASDYIDRDGGADHMIDHDDVCFKIFQAHGFTWGGDWNSLKDYQHFEKVVTSY